MAYTLSFDASVKVSRGAVAGLLHHIGRDVDRQQGREVRHANQDIDAARTGSNLTMVTDGSGNWRACRALGEVKAALDARLADVKKPLRKDAVVLRPLILQLDPEWYAAHQGEDERQAAAWDMVEWAADTFGGGNLLYIARHEDEGNPHLHIGFCPVTDDGRLSQKDWFPGPAALRAMHKSFREYMAGRGYDIAMDNQKPGKHAKRLSVQEYKDFRELEKQRAELDAREARIKAQEARATQDKAQAVQELKAAQEARRKAQEAQERAERREREADGIRDEARRAADMKDAFAVSLGRRNRQDEAKLRERERQLRRREQEVAAREAEVELKEAAMDAMTKARYERQLQLQEQQRREREQQRQRDGEALLDRMEGTFPGVQSRGPCGGR